MLAQDVINTFTEDNDKHIAFFAYRMDEEKAVFYKDGVKLYNGISVDEYRKVVKHFTSDIKINNKACEVKAIQGWIKNGQLKAVEISLEDE